MWEVPVHRISKHTLEEDRVAPQIQRRAMKPLTPHLARGAPLSFQLHGNSVLTLIPDHSCVYVAHEVVVCVGILRHCLQRFAL